MAAKSKLKKHSRIRLVIPLVLLNNAMRSTTGFIFRWKLTILIITLLSAVIIYRPFCRYICPQGAII